MDTAAAYFQAKLDHETDVDDVASALRAGAGDFTLVDVRSAEAWAQGRVPGAVHLPRAEIAARALHEIDRAKPVVVHCWGPGCNGATKAALGFADLGFSVKEMIGGFEYWVREGFDVETDRGVRPSPADPLAALLKEPGCGC
ncbi:MAG: rhodanese-like domain-containing protein [Segniliparus sp.]|uniref:rhodanese-like domain-containing protein n=1 Tax=Segniliparus sp. TaxID=2804064 RepID=UPI003F39D0FB